ncbi:hypothetical protein TRVL_08980 [Trypanosoma vivax]|nr:hypothetical protein TRVL_08980 [Trypanosoma vivax]
MVCALRWKNEVHLVKIRGLGRTCALEPGKKHRNGTLMYRNGCACQVCGENFGRQVVLVKNVAKNPPEGKETNNQRQTTTDGNDRSTDGTTPESRWSARPCATNAWLRKKLLLSRPESRLSSGAAEAQCAPEKTERKTHEEREQGTAFARTR